MKEEDAPAAIADDIAVSWIKLWRATRHLPPSMNQSFMNHNSLSSSSTYGPKMNLCGWLFTIYYFVLG